MHYTGSLTPVKEAKQTFDEFEKSQAAKRITNKGKTQKFS